MSRIPCRDEVQALMVRVWSILGGCVLGPWKRAIPPMPLHSKRASPFLSFFFSLPPHMQPPLAWLVIFDSVSNVNCDLHVAGRVAKFNLYPSKVPEPHPPDPSPTATWGICITICRAIWLERHIDPKLSADLCSSSLSYYHPTVNVIIDQI